MNNPQIAVVTIPINEWHEQSALLRKMAEQMQVLTRKEQKELLTVGEVCAMLKIGRTTFERYMANGVIEVVKFNRKKYTKNYVRREHLESLINEGVV